MSWNPLRMLGDGLKALTGSDFGINQELDVEDNKELKQFQSRLNREEMAYSAGIQQNNQEWLMNRQYPAMVSGMKYAGLNPATANGTSPATPGLVSPSTGAASGSAPQHQHLDPLAMAQVENTRAQTQLLNSQKEKTDAEKQAQENINDTYSESFENTMNELKSRADQQFSQGKLNSKRIDEIDQNIKNLQKTVESLDQSIKESKQRVLESKARTNFTGKQARSWDGFIQSQIKHYLASANLLNGQNAREGQMLLFNMSSAAAMADYYDSQTYINRGIAKWNNFLMNQDMKFKEWQNWINLGTQVINCVGDNFYKVASGLSGFMPFTSHTYQSGTSPLGYNFGMRTDVIQQRQFGW